MRCRGLFSLCLLAATGCYDAPFDRPGDDRTPPPVTTTIRTLYDHFAGPTFAVTGDLSVRGRVTANDRGGNFYRMLVIESDGAGLAIDVAVDRLQNDFPEGCSVTLRLKGLALGMHYGVLQAGRMPVAGSGGTTDPIPSKAALDAVLTRDSEAVETPEPAPATLATLTQARCGTLVRIDGLRYAPEELVASSWAGYKRFVDATGAAIHTYVSDYADFAAEEVPAGSCSLTGILQYDDRGDGRFLLKLRDATDCKP